MPSSRWTASSASSFSIRAQKIFGYTVTEVLGQPLDILLPKRLVDAHRHHIVAFGGSAIVARRMGERNEILGRRKDGKEFPAEASFLKWKWKARRC